MLSQSSLSNLAFYEYVLKRKLSQVLIGLNYRTEINHFNIKELLLTD